MCMFTAFLIYKCRSGKSFDLPQAQVNFKRWAGGIAAIILIRDGVCVSWRGVELETGDQVRVLAHRYLDEVDCMSSSCS